MTTHATETNICIPENLLTNNNMVYQEMLAQLIILNVYIYVRITHFLL